VISDLIRREIEGLIDQRAWRAAVASEQQGSELLAGVAKNWTKIRKLLARAHKRPRGGTNHAQTR
jgi:hypothetical protein